MDFSFSLKLWEFNYWTFIPAHGIIQALSQKIYVANTFIPYPRQFQNI